MQQQPRKVSFNSQGLKIAAHLYLPQDGGKQKNQAAIAIGHPLGGVKEQVVSIYAKKLSTEGFITLTFDAACSGESEGEPRNLEDPFQRSEDIKSAVTYLSTLPQVDPERIGALGICAGGGYVSFASQTDIRIKAVAGVSMADTGKLHREGFKGSSTIEDLQKGLIQAGKDRIAEARGAAPRMVNIVPCTLEDANALPERSMVREAYDYYNTPRAQHPNAKNQYVFRSLDKLAQFSSFTYNYLISPRPYLAIAGSDADTFYLSEDAIEIAKEPKELYTIKGASHIDLYDRPKYVDPAVAKLVDFYTQHLANNNM